MAGNNDRKPVRFASLADSAGDRPGTLAQGAIGFGFTKWNGCNGHAQVMGFARARGIQGQIKDPALPREIAAHLGHGTFNGGISLFCVLLARTGDDLH